jgi:hypothetical protein
MKSPAPMTAAVALRFAILCPSSRATITGQAVAVSYIMRDLRRYGSRLFRVRDAASLPIVRLAATMSAYVTHLSCARTSRLDRAGRS